MCGIFGFAASEESSFDRSSTHSLLDRFFLLSESRGKDACGLALSYQDEITVLKRPVRARELVQSKEYKSLVNTFQKNLIGEPSSPGSLVLVGHARMVTNGSEETHENNQPVIKDGMVCLHNGIIVNDAELWDQFPALQRNYEVDTEVLNSLVGYYRGTGLGFVEATRSTFAHLQGANSIILLADDINGLVMASTNGSLFFAKSEAGSELAFASEKYILQMVIQHQTIKDLFTNSPIVQVLPGDGYALSLDTMDLSRFRLSEDKVYHNLLPSRDSVQTIQDLVDARPKSDSRPIYNPEVAQVKLAENDRLIARINEAVSHFRRCTCCLLPETFPFIEYDEKGVCNYCRTYRQLEFKGEKTLQKLAGSYRSRSDQPDCLVALSGGRDSSFGIHYIKNVLNMNPVAYTYDWGMVTDLARRNISRLCGQMGIEHILISADIRKKRKNIRRNVSAWLKRPHLGTVPLFMAGDKQFFYFANMLKKQMELPVVFFNMNRLEQTDFKVGFCNINEVGQKEEKHYALSATNQIRMAFFYALQYAKNPAFINRSLIDTVFAFFSYYMIPKDFETLYDYVPWIEKDVDDVLINEYDWEVAADTESTWRIGDGTAPFYNYIYYMMAGFTENDTFRSNQIREGLIDRETALTLVERDNQPRYDSIRWYCEIIGIDFLETLRVINGAPRLFAI